MLAMELSIYTQSSTRSLETELFSFNQRGKISLPDVSSSKLRLSRGRTGPRSCLLDSYTWLLVLTPGVKQIQLRQRWATKDFGSFLSSSNALLQ